MRALPMALAVLAALPARAGVEVDLELVLAVDISSSMSGEDLAIQRRGYGEALTSPEVLAAIEGGFLGRIAVTYVEWSDAGHQRVLAGWRLIEGAGDAAGVAALIVGETGGTTRLTSISEGLRFAAGRLAESPYTAPRQVIDISGDGPNNDGPPVTAARDEVVAMGITINGLPLRTDPAEDPVWHIPGLDAYYRDCVIGGPGAFVVPVAGWEAFGEAVRRKMVLEISGLGAAGLRPAQAGTPVQPDCLVGERIRSRRRDGG